MTRQSRRHERGMTLLEVLVSLGVLAMISLLIYGAFDSLSSGVDPTKKTTAKPSACP